MTQPTEEPIGGDPGPRATADPDTGRAGGSGAEARMRAAGIVLPEPFRPVGSYVEARRWHDQLFMSGAGPVQQDGRLVTGKVGADISLVEAQHAARLTGLQLLAIAREQLGTLDRIAAVLRVFGMVNCAPGFTDTPEVLNGCSEVVRLFVMKRGGLTTTRSSASA